MKKREIELTLAPQLVERITQLAKIEHREPSDVCAILIEWALQELGRAGPNRPALAARNLSEMLARLHSNR